MVHNLFWVAEHLKTLFQDTSDKLKLLRNTKILYKLKEFLSTAKKSSKLK